MKLQESTIICAPQQRSRSPDEKKPRDCEAFLFFRHAGDRVYLS